jgi:isopropylmalate/homocitrate/citramalate synthase
VKFDVERVRIVEVGPRDGLQNEKAIVPTEAKVRFIEALADAGLPVVEAGAFVHPTWVPQMADTADVYRAVEKRANVDYPVLVPNLKGLERAIEADVRSIAIFTAASETFNTRNINMSIDESFETFTPVAMRARQEGIRVRGYVSCACGCPYEGAVPAEKVLEVAARLLDLGCHEVSIGDTIGTGTPLQVQGLTSGNMATEDLVYMLDSIGIETGVDLARLVAASDAIAPHLDHPLPGKYLQSCTGGRQKFGVGSVSQ